jgi:hypothetical protein
MLGAVVEMPHAAGNRKFYLTLFFFNDNCELSDNKFTPDEN